jgi:hypothetical protein
MAARLLGRLVVVVTFGLAVACDDGITAPSARVPVIRAFLYENEPVNDVRLSWTMTLDAADSVLTRSTMHRSAWSGTECVMHSCRQAVTAALLLPGR